MPSKREPAPIGKKFGMLTILSEAPDVIRGKNNVRFVNCQCECGKFRSVNLVSLLNFQTRSCGCSVGRLQSETFQRNKALQIKGDYSDTFHLQSVQPYRELLGPVKREKLKEIQDIEDMFFKDHTKINDHNLDNWLFRTREFLDIKQQTLNDILSK